MKSACEHFHSSKIYTTLLLKAALNNEINILAQNKVISMVTTNKKLKRNLFLAELLF